MLILILKILAGLVLILIAAYCVQAIFWAIWLHRMMTARLANLKRIMEENEENKR